MNTRHRSAALVAVAALALGGCGSHSGAASKNDSAQPKNTPAQPKNTPAQPKNDPAASKAGGKGAPIVITIADSQPQGRPSNLPLDEFKSQVAALSDGSISVMIKTLACEDAPVPGSDEPIIAKLRAGTFEMAVVPARAWSTVGVSTLRPLQAPFLAQSDAQIDAVVRDASVVSSLFAGLNAVGVHGLTMFPESLRHYFSFTSPILTPDDVKGRTIRNTSSTEVASITTTLGATPVDPPSDEFHAGVANGTITAADSGFAVALSSTPRPGIATGNLVLYAKVITLVANSKFWDGLTDAQRDALTTAAQRTQEWAIANRISDQEAAKQYCAGGGTVVVTLPEEVAKFRAAVAPIYAELERDPEAKRTIAAIAALGPTAQQASLQPCGSPTVASAPKELVAEGGDLPNGVYRVEYTQEYLKAHGEDDRGAQYNYGVWTYRLQDGQWSFERVAATNCCTSEDRQVGIYQVEGDNLYWKFTGPHEAALDPLHLTWSVDSDGTLHFTDVDTQGLGWVFDLPWPRIGDV